MGLGMGRQERCRGGISTGERGGMELEWRRDGDRGSSVAQPRWGWIRG